jgi:geranylgeranyl diphosphate synthase type II
MTLTAVKEQLGVYGEEVGAFLDTCLQDRGIPESLHQAMRYSLMAGGKRVRPVLCLCWAEMFGAPKADILPFAAGLELIHSYSLVHDDLPAMDDADTRRGKPASHKKFGEAMAILAGDGLLTEAFSLMLSAPVDPARLTAAAAEMAGAAGAGGMVGGQVLDMEHTGAGAVALEDLRRMHSLKTGALIRSACVCGAMLAGAGRDGVSRARDYGVAVGVAFQIVDDILDVVGDAEAMGKPVGADAGAGKNTYPELLGLDESYRLAREYVEAAVKSLDGRQEEPASFLAGLARYILDRAT